MVGDGQRASLFVERYAHGEVAELALELAFLCQGLHLLCCVNSVGHHLTEENLVIRIEELFDYGEDVLCSNPDITFLHSAYSLFLFFFACCFFCKHLLQKVCQMLVVGVWLWVVGWLAKKKYQ